MKKFFKWLFIVLSVLLVLLLAAAVALPFVLPLDKIKDFAAQKMSETLQREVKIGKVSFNVFTGIGIENFYISNRPGFAKAPFISAKKIELKYDLWSLFTGRFKINKIALVKPEILIEKKGDQFNFSDLVPATGPAPKPTPKTETKKTGEGKPPVLIDISAFSIKDAALTYMEYIGTKQEKSGFSDLDLAVTGVTIDLSRPIGLALSANVLYQGKPVPVSLSGLAKVNMAKEKASVSGFKVGAAGEYLSGNVNISSLSKDQNIRFDVASDRINIDKFLAIISGKPTPEKKVEKPAPAGELTKTVNSLAKSIPSGVRVDGDIALKNITYKKMALDALNLKVTLIDRVLKISSKDTMAYKGDLDSSLSIDFNRSGLGYAAQEMSLAGFNASPFTNSVVDSFLGGLPGSKDLKNKVFGDLNFNAKISGAGVEFPAVLKNANGDLSFELKDGALKKLSSLAALGDKIGISTLKSDMEIKVVKAKATINKGILNISSLHADNGDKGDAVVDFKGALDLVKQKYVPGNVVTVRLSPSISQTGFDSFKDDTGWAVLDFELTGDLSKPIPIPKLDKAFEKAKKSLDAQIKKESDKQKQELGAKVSAESEKQKEELKKQAEEKLKELLKIQ